MSLKMRIGLGQFNELTDEKLAYIKPLHSKRIENDHEMFRLYRNKP